MNSAIDHRNSRCWPPWSARAIAGLLAVMVFAGESTASVLDRVEHDLSQGRDVVVTSYVGLWYRDPPRLNLFWGALYGHDSLFDRPSEIEAKLPFLEVTRYETLYEDGREQDPLAIKVVASVSTTRRSEAPRRGRIVVVYLAYRDMEQAVLDMGAHLKTGRIPEAVAGIDAVATLLDSSYVVGYWGHNVHYGGLDIDDLEELPVSRADRPNGVFMVGCMTAQWIPSKFVADGVEPLLFTTTNMAPEAYIAFALYDGLARGLPKNTIRENVARAYQVYQRLRVPPSSLFINDAAEIARYERDAKQGRW